MEKKTFGNVTIIGNSNLRACMQARIPSIFKAQLFLKVNEKLTGVGYRSENRQNTLHTWLIHF